MGGRHHQKYKDVKQISKYKAGLRMSCRIEQLKHKPQMEQWSAGGMTSSNVKTVAKPSDGVVAVLKSLHFALP